MSTATTSQFHLPDVGEGLTEAEIVSWLVRPGDLVEVNQPVVEIETAKSVVELPSPFAGRVSALHAEAGETVAVGRVIISVESGAAADERPTTTDDPQLLVGYGAREPGAHRRRRRGGAPAAPVAEAAPAARPLAKPPVRKLARDAGVDLAAVTPTGAGGVITRADVLRASEQAPAAYETAANKTAAPEAAAHRVAAREVAAHRAVATGATAPEVLAGGDLRIPIRGVRKHTAAAVTASAFTAPHVTEFVTIDVTRTMELREEIARRPEFRDVKLSPLALVARAFLHALARTPEANSRWDERAQEIVQLAEVNLGIAAATPRGLVVPNVKSAQRLSLLDLTLAINDLAATARAGRTEPAAMAGGTVTITNIGVFGIDTGTPILNPGETAILALGAVRRMPWVVEDRHGERIEPRWVTQLALSFDHRVLDGQQGSQLLADTAAQLTQPGLAVL
ncbi:dihydrolipoamide acetyltransferase family protein [Umezawaea beigongshangensis]|uniref:dihydrolipoamide acetyltransferase family protein n=1 Tax=Umezawaea beigongshangensis TaxID=2780383 RepID=UPI0018F1A501|nr:dihydrolipoamide acetyltransferase family protein [Umezawaea beigongshangensis]